MIRTQKGPEMRSLLLFIFFVLSLEVRAEPLQVCEGGYKFDAPFKVPCSATWQLQGVCHGRDLALEWKVTGRTQSKDSFIRPWLGYPITVVGYELMKLETPRPWLRRLFGFALDRTDWWFMIGSTIQPDGMLSLGPGEVRASRIWPAGYGQPWPAKDNETPNNGHVGDLIDVHGQCYGGEPVTLLLTVFYYGR